MKKWEYKVVKQPLKGIMNISLNAEVFDEALNQLGDEGWELVNCSTVESNGYTKEIIAVLKKAKDV